LVFAEQSLIACHGEYALGAVGRELRMPGYLSVDQSNDVLVGQSAAWQLGFDSSAVEHEAIGQATPTEVLVVVHVVFGQDQRAPTLGHTHCPVRGPVYVDEGPPFVPQLVEDASELQGRDEVLLKPHA
jgi:hypothetical protein